MSAPTNTDLAWDEAKHRYFQSNNPTHVNAQQWMEVAFAIREACAEQERLARRIEGKLNKAEREIETLRRQLPTHSGHC